MANVIIVEGRGKRTFEEVLLGAAVGRVEPAGLEARAVVREEDEVRVVPQVRVLERVHHAGHSCTHAIAAGGTENEVRWDVEGARKVRPGLSSSLDGGLPLDA